MAQLRTESMGMKGTRNHAVREYLLPVKRIRTNIRTSRIPFMVERKSAFFNRMFNFDHTIVTTGKKV